ncbi:MAG TPA: hypothetical protein VL294_12150 [Pseudolysinimonas sp.]|jgi:hypothetical protein|nr:hypothetical protein [Pseudolysinimonas sp.]
MSPFRKRNPEPALDQLPCVDCGQAVMDPTRVVKLIATAREVRLANPGPVIIQDGAWEYRASRCDRCQTRLWRAEGLAEEHPVVVRKLGSKAYAIELIDSALIGLVNVGRAADEWEPFVRTDRQLMRLVRRLAGPAMSLRWSSNLVPTVRLGGDVFHTDTSPWSHVTDEQTQALRDAYAPLLWDHLGLPRTVKIPDDGLPGCLYCGVQRAEASAGSGEEVWGELRRAQPKAVGGAFAPTSKEGYLCPPCNEAVESIGMIGPRSLALALMNFLQVSAPVADFWLPGLQAWCVLPEGTKPNADPWGHIDDLPRVKAMIRWASAADMEKPQLDGRPVAKVR